MKKKETVYPEYVQAYVPDTEDLAILEKSDKLIALLTGGETTESKF